MYSEQINNFNEENKEAEEHPFLGVRFEKKLRKVGELPENSKSNPERVDPRDFPEFDSEEYVSLPDAGGVCAYDIDFWGNHIDLEDLKEEGYHVYILSGSRYTEGEDYDEMVLGDAKIVAVIF